MTKAGYVAIAILLLGSGDVIRRAATVEDNFAASAERLATQGPAGPVSPEDASSDMQLLASIPVVGRSIRIDLLRHRALVAYWRGDYAALTTPAPDAQPADDVTRFVQANAIFRELATRPGNNEALVRGLDAVLKSYASVLEVNPNAVDAAYNYEFVARLRGAIAAGRPNSIKLPSRSNLHGEQGTPPAQTRPGEFNIIVPLNPEERQEQIDPRAGTVPQRKG